jgi:hypothetical protein
LGCPVLEVAGCGECGDCFACYFSHGRCILG